MGLDQETFAAVDDALASEWEALGLTALRMNDLSDVALVIRELQCVGLNNYETPNRRARRVWTSHSRRFARLQTEHSNALIADAEMVSTVLGAKAQQATLWLANGRGMLARWATEGTRYRSTHHLKFVPTGYDSPWIAGEAIGSEEVKLKDISRDRRLAPKWQSVLAIPIFAGDGRPPDFASAVLTFGLSKAAPTLLKRQEQWSNVAEELSTIWGARIADIAFPKCAG